MRPLRKDPLRFYIQTGSLTVPADVAALEHMAPAQRPSIPLRRSTAWTYVWGPLLSWFTMPWVPCGPSTVPPSGYMSEEALRWEREKALRAASVVSQGVPSEVAHENVQWSDHPPGLR